MTKIGRFNFLQSSGSPGTHTVKVSADAFTGRKKPATASIVVRKQNGGLEKYLTIEQSAAGQFFKIDRIDKETLSTGVTVLTVRCSGNIPLKNVVCGGLEYYGLRPTAVNASTNTGGVKPWVVNYLGQDISIGVQKTNDYGVVMARAAESLDFISEEAAYVLTAYLTAPKVSSETEYDFFFGRYSGDLNVPVSNVLPNDTVTTASRSVGKIIITPPEVGYLRLSVSQLLPGNNDSVDSGYLEKVYVDSNSSWEIDPDSLEDWVVIGYPDASDAEYGKYFTVTMSGPNTATEVRDCTVRVQLTADTSVCSFLTITQGQSSAAWLHVFFTQTSNFSGNPLKTRIPAEGLSTSMVVYANGPWTLNSDSFPSWIHLGTEYDGSEPYHKIYDVTFDPINGADREFDVVASLTGTSVTYTRTVAQEIPVDVYVTALVSPERPYADMVVEKDLGHGNIVWLRTFQAQSSDTAFARTFKFSINATGEWTYGLQRNAEVLEKTQDSITIKFTRISSSALFDGNVNLMSNDEVRGSISTSPSEETLARILNTVVTP